MRYITVLLGSILMVACGGDSTGPANDANVAGQWSFGETLSAPSFSLSYVGTGTVQLSQSGSQFSGTADEQVVVSGPNGSVNASGSGTISGGQINGNSVSFQASTCDYSGTASGNPTNRLEGTVGCDVDVQGQTIHFTGTWQAGR